MTPLKRQQISKELYIGVLTRKLRLALAGPRAAEWREARYYTVADEKRVACTNQPCCKGRIRGKVPMLEEAYEGKRLNVGVIYRMSNLISRVQRKVARRPDILWNQARRKFNEVFLWERRYRRLRYPKTRLAVSRDEVTDRHVMEALVKAGITFEEYMIDIDGYMNYLLYADYSRFPEYFGGGNRARLPGPAGKKKSISKIFNPPGFTEKSLEHYVASQLLELSPDDVFIDIANAYSPVPEIYSEISGCRSYRQDLIFPEGIFGEMIGGDACDLPLKDGFATKMALHCSFEHFEGDSDIRFIREADRVLQEGGRLCILPLYLFREYAVQTDPAMISEDSPVFEDDAVLYCVKGWGNRHGRFYDASHFLNRIAGNMGRLKLKICIVKNEKEVSPDVYLKFAAIFFRR